MSCSPARFSNDRTKPLSATGSEVPARQATERVNAFPPGCVGQGDRLGRDDSLELIAMRAAAFGRELGATGVVGQILAHRAAWLSVRMENLAVQQLVASAADIQRARAEFDADRLAEIRRWVAELDGHKVNRGLEFLQSTPDGLTHLIASWDRLRAEIQATERPGAIALARHRLGRGADPTEPLAPSELLRQIDQERDRLGHLAGSMESAAAAIEQARGNAGVIASFNPAPAATLARRHEAAAERGMYRAIRAIADFNRRTDRAESAPASTASPAEPADSTPPPAAEPAALASFGAGATAATSAPLASFGAGGSRAVLSGAWLPMAASQPPEAPRERPDLRKWERKLARKRR